MIKKTIPVFVALSLAACASSSVPVDFIPLSEVTEKRAPILAHIDTRHDWNNHNSFALNIANLSGGHTGLMDADLPENAQREITGRYRVGNFLVNAWAGNFTQAAALDSLPRNRREAYRFEPYGIVFVDADYYDAELKNTSDGGFGYVFEQLASDIVPILSSEYDDDTVEMLMWNNALVDYYSSDVRYSWPLDVDFVITSHGGACKAGRDVSAIYISTHEGALSESYRNTTMTGFAAAGYCRIYGEVESLGYVNLDDGAKYAFKVELSNNYFTAPLFALNSKHTWVISTYWKDAYHTRQVAYPFVTYGDNAWLFTRSNDSIPLEEL